MISYCGYPNCQQKEFPLCCEICANKCHTSCVKWNQTLIKQFLAQSHIQIEEIFTECLNYGKFLNLKQIILEQLNQIEEEYEIISQRCKILERLKNIINAEHLSQEQWLEAGSLMKKRTQSGHEIKSIHYQIDESLKIIQRAINCLFQDQSQLNLQVKQHSMFGYDGKIKANWKNMSMKYVHSFTSIISSYSISPNDQFIACALYNNNIQIFNLNNGMQIGKDLIGHSDQITTLAYTSDNKYLISRSEDQTMCIWDWRSNIQIGPPITIPTTGSRFSISVSPDPRYFVTVNKERAISIWDIGDITAIKQCQHIENFTNERVSYSPSGYIMISLLGSNLAIWNIFRGKKVKEAKRVYTYNFIFYNSNRLVLLSSYDRISMWSLKPLKRLNSIISSEWSTSNLSLGLNSNLLATDDQIFNLSKKTQFDFTEDSLSLQFTNDSRSLIRVGEYTFEVYEIE